MAKRIQIGNQFYRMRRGKLVLIPDEWVGKITHQQTKRKRPSNALHKLRKRVKNREFAS
jgi:hypothetical protein